MREILMLAALLILQSCGGNDLKIIEEKLVCSQPNLCSSESMTCIRDNYYGNEWRCTIVLTGEE